MVHVLVTGLVMSWTGGSITYVVFRKSEEVPISVLKYHKSKPNYMSHKTKVDNDQSLEIMMKKTRTPLRSY